MRRVHVVVVGTALATLLAGCDSLVLPTALGGQCELTSECDAPLVCRIEFCRKECATSRDCGAGLVCVQDNDGLGACQLPEDRSCTINSDCPDPLVCKQSQCTNACNCDPDEDTTAQACRSRDCVAGAWCVLEDDGSRACIDSSQACVWDTDCQPGTLCIDERCRQECRSVTTGTDCRSGEVCYEDDFGGEPVPTCFCEFPATVADIDVRRDDVGLPPLATCSQTEAIVID